MGIVSSKLTTITGNFDSGVASAGVMTFNVRPMSSITTMSWNCTREEIHAQSSAEVSVFTNNEAK